MSRESNALESIIASARESQEIELYLSFKELTALPDSLFELIQLESLVLSGNELEYLDERIGQLENLKMLDLSGNKLRELPSTLTELAQLNHLDLASNQLNQLPDSMGQLRNLTLLDCFGNNLEFLPASIGECKNLVELKLGENDLRFLPDSLGDLLHLNALDVSFNELSKLPHSLIKLHRLQELHLNGNCLNIPIRYLGKYIFEPQTLLSIYHEQIAADSAQAAANHRKECLNAATQKLVSVLEHHTALWNSQTKRIDIMPTDKKQDCGSVGTMFLDLHDELRVVASLASLCNTKESESNLVMPAITSQSTIAENWQQLLAVLNRLPHKSLSLVGNQTNHQPNVFEAQLILSNNEEQLFSLIWQIRHYAASVNLKGSLLEQKTLHDAVLAILKHTHLEQLELCTKLILATASRVPAYTILRN